MPTVGHFQRYTDSQFQGIHINTILLSHQEEGTIRHVKNNDPLGIVIPVKIIAKLFIKELWHKQLNWDEPLPEDMRTRWHNIRDDLQ